MKTKELVDAKKVRLGREEALELAQAASKVIVARGKKIIEHDMKKDPPLDDDLAKGIMGPSGNLRAPTLKVGKTLLVGFHEDAYEQVMGK
ncbi:MAG: hypothetical protein H8E43_01625 [Planctomycetia bacterium]|nr:hypothetical protein [Planctomycetia bacterium]MBL6915132.1 hypothetical protein [Planctomycetota bacterium]HCW44303.1 hypothetical protein [Planctomycetota bacterium]